jgi:hypothetical protein
MNRDDFSSTINQLKQFWNGLSKPEKATWIAVTLGFIVDSIAIVHIILAIRLTQVDYGVISSGTAFGIWLIAGFMYLSFLKAYWEKNRKIQIFHRDFRFFLLRDLLFNFEKPLLLLPLVLLTLLFFGILGSVDPQGALNIMVGTCLGFVLLLLIMFKFIGNEIVNQDKEMALQRPTEDFKQQVEDNWGFWERRIDIELSKRIWITWRAFPDIIKTDNLSRVEIEYILARYASKNPEQVRFGTIRKRFTLDSGDLWKYVESGALVNLKYFDHNNYEVDY